VYVTGKFANQNANLAIVQIMPEGAEIWSVLSLEQIAGHPVKGWEEERD
jgi:hypothetical protein